MRTIKKTLFAALLSVAMVGCSQNDSGADAPPGIPVTIAQPTVKDLKVYLETIGTLQPVVAMEIRPQTFGTLQQIYVNAGDWVQKDTPLFLIDPRTYAIKVHEAEAQLAIDKAHLKVTNKKLERFHTLAQKDLMPQTEWDDLEAQAEKAQGAVALDEARLMSAQLELEKCTLRSPIDGRVGVINVDEGALISAGHATPLTTVEQLHPLIAEFTITEKEFPQIPRDDLTFEMSTLCSAEEASCKEGKVSFLDNHFDAKSGLLLVRGKVDNHDYSLRPGQSIRVKLPIKTISDAMLIPQKTIRYNQEGPYVYVVQDDMTVVTRKLTLGDEFGENQLVLEGLQPEDKIILDGHLRLSAGSKVAIQS